MRGVDMQRMDKPALSDLQRAWLQEIGIDARMLAHFSAAPFAEPPTENVAENPTPAPGKAPAPVLERPSRPAGLVPVAAVLAKAAASPPVSPAAAMLADVTLADLRERAAHCEACGLHEVRGRSVFGEGAGQAPRWMFVGEAPGEVDDSMGKPFQGRAGELLQAMLASVDIAEDAPVYFTNVLKCRPMGNRSPEAAEIAACLPLLRRQITLLRPGCLVAMGRVAAAALLGRDDELDVLRGSVHGYVDDEGRSIPLVVTHHPASLLLHARLKADAWRDLNLLRGLGG